MYLSANAGSDTLALINLAHTPISIFISFDVKKTEQSSFSSFLSCVCKEFA